MNYKKHGISFLIADFFRSSKTQIFFSCLLYVFGLILAVVFYNSPEADKVVDTGRIIGKTILIILPCYIVAMFSTFFKYVVLLFFCGFFVSRIYVGTNRERPVCGCRVFGNRAVCRRVYPDVFSDDIAFERFDKSTFAVRFVFGKLREKHKLQRKFFDNN